MQDFIGFAKVSEVGIQNLGGTTRNYWAVKISESGIQNIGDMARFAQGLPDRQNLGGMARFKKRLAKILESW